MDSWRLLPYLFPNTDPMGIERRALWGFWVVLLGISAPLWAQNDFPAARPKAAPSLLQRVYGSTPKPSVLYHPWRSHYWPYQDIGYTHLYGATYKSIAYFSFINTYSERCHLVAFRRNWVESKRWTVAAGAGINYGYDGRLYFAQSIPRWIRETYLFKTDLNPMAGLDISYRIAPNLQAQLIFSPIFVTWGASYQLGKPQRGRYAGG